MVPRPWLVWIDGGGKVVGASPGRELPEKTAERISQQAATQTGEPLAGRAVEFEVVRELPQGGALRCVVIWPGDGGPRGDFFEHRPAPPVRRSTAMDQILGDSPAIREAKEFAARAATVPVPVLIEGETGTGKELFARAIHELSPMANGPFVAVNCGAIPESLAEAEFFGHEPGAFTGATRSGRKGLFEQAHGGTLFLDEISELPVPLQAKLLRVLEEGVVRRLGGSRVYPVAVRLIAASNRPLRDLVRAGSFRADLYYRLNVITLRLPPLRARQDDVITLFLFFFNQARQRWRKAPAILDPAAITALRKYPWPGNVREVRNVALRLAVAVEGDRVTARHVERWLGAEADLSLPDGEGQDPGSEGPSPVPPGSEGEASPRPLRDAAADAERRAIEEALARAGGNKARAARLLGIHRATLYDKLRRYGLM